jgi:hypothetical protein
MKRLIFPILLLAVLGAHYASAQMPCMAETPEYPAVNSCPTDSQSWAVSGIANKPFVDADCTNGCPTYGDPPYNDVISLYGNYGNLENSGNAAVHYTNGVNQGKAVVPLNTSGVYDPNGKIVMLVLGFSNCEIEVCGGSEDIWQDQVNPPPPPIPGQPCSTYYGGCPNLPNSPPYNAIASNDGVTQNSFLYQIYSPSPWLVDPHVVIFSAAVGGQSLEHYDPLDPNGFANPTHHCPVPSPPHYDPVCDYDAATLALTSNGYSAAQVQVIYLKSSNEVPLCDLKFQWCAAGQTVPNALLEEQHLGNILRYLKLGVTTGGTSYQTPYPNLKQVFLTTRIYGGYANGTPHGCLSPEPYAYEEGFAVQRLIVAQIDSKPDSNGYSGAVDLNSAPWFDWGPYLWADGDKPRSFDGLQWCNNNPAPSSCNGKFDVRYGYTPDLVHYWGDYTHPTANGAQKAASQMVTFFGHTSASLGSPFVQPWNWNVH